jgi:hypothetical protein
MANANNTTAVATATLTNSLLNDLSTVGTIVNHSNRTMIQELYGERIVSKTPPTDITLPNNFALPDWSISLRNLVPKYQDILGIQKAIKVSMAIIQSFLPYAPFVQGIKGSNGKLCNIILTFKSTSEMNRMVLAEALEGSNITELESILDLSSEKYYSFKERAYLMLDGTVISAE